MNYSLKLIASLLVLLNLMSGCASEKRAQFPALVPNYQVVRSDQQQWQIQRGKQVFTLLAVSENSTLVLMNTLGQRLATFEKHASRISYQQLIGHPVLANAQELGQCWELGFKAKALQDVKLAPKWQLTSLGQDSQLLFSGILRATITQAAETNSEAEFRCHFVRDALFISVSSQRID